MNKRPQRCFGSDPELFFPHPADRAGQAQAKAYCRECSTRVECLILALRNEGTRAASGRAGIYGGMTEEERAAFTRRYGRIAAAIEAARQSALVDEDEGALVVGAD
ncbi:MAG TPA: WhiB family transcriptional regulator [Glycomyces sp.]|nr:WhiB family transcriptional regulator [Glycomyces sp.]